MILQRGMYINDGENDLLICEIKKHEEALYAYVLNENTDEVGFYKVIVVNDVYEFELVEDEKLIEELILAFAKDYALEFEKQSYKESLQEDLSDNGENV